MTQTLHQTPFFSVSFPDVPHPLVDIWEAIRTFLAVERCLPEHYQVSQIAGHREEDQAREYLKLSPDEISSFITERRLDGFHLSSGRKGSFFDLRMSNSKNVGPHANLTCYIERGANCPINWNALIESLMTLTPTIGGWQWGHLYRCWQWMNRGDIDYERRWGLLPPGYRTWREPGPLALTPQPDQVFIDISMNPGRPKVLAFGVNFYPTAEMWLGPHFWQYAKCSKEEALAADFFIEKRDTPHYLYLKCWPDAFTRPDGEQGRMQQRLWKLFFHEDCEWPPGSGTICDEPMYGPPELMPGYENTKK